MPAERKIDVHLAQKAVDSAANRAFEVFGLNL